MTRRLFVLFSLSIIALSGSTFLPLTHSANQEPSGQAHTTWVLQTLEKMETIKPGMTREDLLKVFRTEGGLSVRLIRTFVSRDCPYFKVDVEFKAAARPDIDNTGFVTSVEDNRDIIVKVSKPYMQLSIAD
jgi:hypothetical protein